MELTRFNNNIHHDNCIPVVQANVKAVSRPVPFPALGLGLACETTLKCDSLPNNNDVDITLHVGDLGTCIQENLDFGPLKRPAIKFTHWHMKNKIPDFFMCNEQILGVLKHPLIYGLVDIIILLSLHML